MSINHATGLAIFEVQDALDWELKQGESLRQALIDAAEDHLGIKDQEGELKVSVINHEIIHVVFTPTESILVE